MSNTIIASRSVGVIRTGNTIKVISLPNRTHTITLNTTLINTSTEVSEENLALIERLVDGLVDGIEDKADLTQEEIESLKSISEKTNTYTVKETNDNNDSIAKSVVSHAESTMNKIHDHQTNNQHKKVFGVLNETERRIVSLRKTLDIYKEDFWQVEYDIPETVKRTKDNPKGVENPSDWFWKHSLRLTKSCWCFPQSSFNHAEVKEWMDDAREKGCDIVVVKYHPDQISTIKEKGAEQLRKAMILYHDNLIKNIIAADERLQAASDKLNEKVLEGETSELTASREQKALEDYRNNQVRNHIRNGAERLKMGIASAEQFDMTENVADLFEAFRQTVLSQQETFNAMARMRGVLGVNVKV